MGVSAEGKVVGGAAAGRLEVDAGGARKIAWRRGKYLHLASMTRPPVVCACCSVNPLAGSSGCILNIENSSTRCTAKIKN